MRNGRVHGIIRIFTLFTPKHQLFIAAHSTMVVISLFDLHFRGNRLSPHRLQCLNHPSCVHRQRAVTRVLDVKRVCLLRMLAA